MTWNRSEAIGLAKASCTHCHGYGLRSSQDGKEYPCNCVLRAIFRACHARFRQCAAREKYLSRVTLELFKGKDRRSMYCRTTEDYLADFCLVSRRVLHGLEYKIFRYYYLLGAGRTLCCQRLGINRGIFFRLIYQIQHKLGRTFRELEPYGLYPVDEYFAGRIRKEPSGPIRIDPIPIRVHGIPLRAPLKKSA